MKKLIYLGLLTLLSLQSVAQDTVKMMTYNLLNFPYVSALRVDTLETILTYVQPDILIVCELQNNSGASSILNNALNVNGVSHYDRATFFNGQASDNMCFYNSNKFGLAAQKQIGTDLRDISEYTLYWKANLPSNDTVYFNVYSCHLKAGSFSSDENQRLTEAQDLKNWLDTKDPQENIFVGGDFNLYSSSELACQEILTGGNVDLFDPINTLGDWNNNATYAAVHTQSTRTSSVDNGSGGGMDDRFDFWFVSSDVLGGNNQVKYIPGTYQAFGQDGSHFNTSINGFPNHPTLPTNVTEALYWMSDHLPVVMEVVVDLTLNVAVSDAKNWNFHYAPSNNELVFSSTENESRLEVSVKDILGKTILVQQKSGKSFLLNPGQLTPGVYIAKVTDGNAVLTKKFVVQ